MKWIRDTTGRFPQRPFFEQKELDHDCEQTIVSFLRAKYNEVKYPISTNDLTILIEKETADLDLYADLSGEGENVEGVTDFIPGSKPRVRIAQELHEPRRENRLRTTLTHELGHVKHHSFLWAIAQLSFPTNRVHKHSPRCKRETIISTSRVDWMEWQAGYACGAYLVPITPLRRLVQNFYEVAKVVGVLPVASTGGQELIQAVEDHFQVSEAAAQVRLLQLDYLTEDQTSSLLPGFS